MPETSGVGDTLTRCRQRSTLVSMRSGMAPSQSVYVRTLLRAADVLGSTVAVADYLDLPVARVTAWMNGAIEIPADMFLRLVDVLFDHDLTVYNEQRPARPPRNRAPPSTPPVEEATAASNPPQHG